MQIYRVHIDNRNYSSWKYIDTSTNLPTENTELDSPLSLRVFHGDEIQNSQIMNSPARKSPYIAGVLLIENNRTYGRTSNKRLLYKCIPDNPLYPAFLVPYEISLKFSKKIVNKYVLFQFHQWKDKHPVGIILETIGDVTDNAAFCEYRLCCRNLRQNSKIKKGIESKIQMEEKRTYLENMIQNSKYSVKDRTTTDYVIAIDPEGSRDYDDAFSCKMIGDSQYVISIHISNVVLWLDHLKLWEFVQNIANVSTVYLPNKRLPMFPSILSENLCSLTADGEKRIAFTLDITLDMTGTILATEFSNTAIRISKNYVYENAECLANPTYRILYEMARKKDANVKDSHDVVAYWMMQMNHIAGNHLAKYKRGIFRKAEKQNKSNDSVGIPDDISQNTRRILQIWESVVSAEYSMYMDNMPTEHCIMGLQNYAHITSPIRRLVDIINQIALMVELQLAELSEDVCMFLKENMQIVKIEYINENSRAIKKTQQECDTLYKIAENPAIMEESWRGIILNIDEERCQAVAYLEDLNLMISVGIGGNDNIVKYNYYMFCVYVFEDEYKIRMKLRWTICES